MALCPIDKLICADIMVSERSACSRNSAAVEGVSQIGAVCAVSNAHILSVFLHFIVIVVFWKPQYLSVMVHSLNRGDLLPEPAFIITGKLDMLGSIPADTVNADIFKLLNICLYRSINIRVFRFDVRHSQILINIFFTSAIASAGAPVFTVLKIICYVGMVSGKMIGNNVNNDFYSICFRLCTKLLQFFFCAKVVSSYKKTKRLIEPPPYR